MSKDEIVFVDKSSEWYQALVEEVDSIIVETTHTAREIQIKGFHMVGKTIRDSEAQANVSTVVVNLAQDLKRPERWLWYAVKFYDTYPELEKELDKFEEGKNLSVNKIIKNYLGGAPKEKEPVTMQDVAYKLFEKYTRDECKQIVDTLAKLCQ